MLVDGPKQEASRCHYYVNFGPYYYTAHTLPSPDPSSKIPC